jgi:glutamate synthase (NADPH) small chain
VLMPDNSTFVAVANPAMSSERVKNQRLPMAERLTTFQEVEQTYTEEEALAEAARCLKCPTHWCQKACPAGVPVTDFIEKVREKNYESAYQLIASASMLPEVCARLCPQEKQCQSNCTRGICTQAVGIGRLERFVVEQHYKNAPKEKKRTFNGKRIAIVGSGASGLSAAEYLAERGYQISVYEKNNRLGGLLEYGIPNMKLDKGVIERRVDALKARGVCFTTCADVGKEISVQQLREKNDAVILAVGTGNARQINMEGSENVRGIVQAVEYLSTSTRSLLNDPETDGVLVSAQGKRVVVIGGGDTGNDCAGVAIRQGCTSITQIEMLPKIVGRTVVYNPYLQKEKESKFDSSQEECLVRFCKSPYLYQTTVKAVYADEERSVTRITIVALEAVIKNGRLTMKEIPGTERSIPCELLIVAAGFIGPEHYVAQAFGVKTTERSSIATDHYATNISGVFACGDCHTGQSLVVKAMVDGRECAKRVCDFLQ